MSGSLFAMPAILLNMGGEMTYILQQRLFAQSVDDEKARKVLQDVIRAMYSPQFIAELFKPQEMYTTASTKQIFEKLAHSSIMRLNKSSMDKLFDLMSMGFKKQVIGCAAPQQLLHVTLTHLESVKNIVQDPVMIENIQGCVDRCITLYGNMSAGQWLLLRQSLLRFLQGKKIKVSLFLQQGLQTVEGSLVVDLGGKLPYGTELPGKHRVFEGNTMVRCVPFYSPISTLGCIECDDAFDMESTQGKNVYMKETDDAVAEAKSSGLSTASFIAASRVILNRIHSAGFKGNAQSRKSELEQVPLQAKHVSQTASSAKAELSMLADLLGMSGASTKEVEEKPFKFSLFPDDDYTSEGKSTSNFIMFDIDGSAGSKNVQQYMEELNLKDEPKSVKGTDDDDDLLALMDSSAK